MRQEYPKESQRRERSNEEDCNAVTVPVKVDGGEMTRVAMLALWISRQL